ncbi:ParB N-terminal domain-containing protein [Streptomyces sp. ADI92-24]|uniref:ParB/RepB/Spo0J family partition protein n=1 Tax=Streptomyces sp. ADI92-24 TaxID=1522756 RepID=UPI0013DE1571|nr:ParB N-terminal domain-containing protein [Streptomyces sp. ADI92-24]
MTTETVEQIIQTPFRFEDVPLSQLTAHPGNVREDLAVHDRFRRSLRKKLRTPLLVTPQADGTYKVIDGHRRLLVMIEDKWETVPVVIDDSRAEDEAGQYVDMVTTAEQRVGLNTREKAAALFQASELGAGVKAIATETGWTQKDVKTAVQVGRAAKTMEAAAQAVQYAWTLDQLEALAEFEDDLEALAELTEAAKGNNFAYRLRRLRDDREETARLAKERAEFVAAGVTVIDEYEALPDSATRIHELLTHDRAKTISEEEHKVCRGHVAAPAEYGSHWVTYCLKPALYDHAVRQSPGSTTTTTKAEDKEARQRTIKGNKHYKAATAARREWLNTWMTRKTFPRDAQVIMARFVAESTLRGDDLGIGDVTSEDGTRMVREWLGIADASRVGTMTAEIVAQADARRLALFPFMACVASYEKTTGHKDNRPWRTDRQGLSDRTRERIGAYLSMLVQLGHSVAPIEQAIIDGEAYDGTEHAAKVSAVKAQEAGQDQLDPK